MASGRGKFGLLFGVVLGVAIVAGAWLGRQNRPLDRVSLEPQRSDLQATPVIALSAHSPTSAPATATNPPSPSNFVMGRFAPPIARGQTPEDGRQKTEDRGQETEDRGGKTEKICPLASAFCPLSPQSWERYAAAAPANPGNLPVIAIVIDDMGLAPARAEAAMNLPAPMTMAILPYARDANQVSKMARAKGHEVLVHLPMEAEGATDPGPQALLAALTPEEFARRLQWNMTRLDGYIGLNNHMGSRLTQDSAAMAVVMQEVKRRGLLFLDSRTAPHTLAASTARALGVTTLERDIFLDNVVTPAAIRAQLRVTEQIARQNGYAIAIGHPHAATVATLQQWAADLKARGFVLAPLSAITRYAPPQAGKRLVSLPPPGG